MALNNCESFLDWFVPVGIFTPVGKLMHVYCHKTACTILIISVKANFEQQSIRGLFRKFCTLRNISLTNVKTKLWWRQIIKLLYD